MKLSQEKGEREKESRCTRLAKEEKKNNGERGSAEEKECTSRAIV